MNRTLLTLIGFIILLLAIAGGAAWYLVSSHQQVVGPGEGQASTTPDTLSGEAIYTSGTYGFLIRYPEMAHVENSFSSYYHLSPSWRANAPAAATGTPVVAFIVYDTKSDHSYPRYYTALVRIGVSQDKREVSTCTSPTKDAGETPLPDAVFGGTTWKAFAFESAGMQQYAKGISYRTVHNGACVALEQIAVGSSYRDDPKSAEDISDEELAKQYNRLDSVVRTFMFVGT